jgi:hypothetical protein
MLGTDSTRDAISLVTHTWDLGVSIEQEVHEKLGVSKLHAYVEICGKEGVTKDDVETVIKHYTKLGVPDCIL